MTVAPCSERLARVRRRFASTLECKIRDTYSALPLLVGQGADIADIMARSYRRIHDIVGVGPSVGFVDTGRAAREVENVLLPAQKAHRGLNNDEIYRLTDALRILRDVSQRELRSL